MDDAARPAVPNPEDPATQEDGASRPDGSCGGFEVAVVDGVPSVRLFGEIDPSNAGGIVDGIGELPGEAVVVDLRDVTFMDSSGAATLVAIRERIGARAEFRVEAGSQVDRLLDLVGLKPHLGIDTI